jgi:hypothetical protein
MPNPNDIQGDSSPGQAASKELVREDSLLEQWTQHAYPRERPEELGILGRLYEGCLALYKPLLKASIQNASRLSDDENGALRRQYQCLCLWGGDFGVGDGHLDEQLEHSRDIHSMILSILLSISEVLARSQCTLAPFFRGLMS